MLGAGADPVKLGPGHSHGAVVIGVVAGAAESFLSQKHQVLLRQASVALHLCLVFHVDGVAQLRPEHLVWNEERHPTLRAAQESCEHVGGRQNPTVYWRTKSNSVIPD